MANLPCLLSTHCFLTAVYSVNSCVAYGILHKARMKESSGELRGVVTSWMMAEYERNRGD